MAGTYLVGGGTHGIGRACVAALARRGEHVVFIGRDVEAGRAVEAACPTATFVACDVRVAAQCRAAVDRALDIGRGALTGLVCNAGASLRKTFDNTSEKEWDDIFAVNTRSAFFLIQAALDGLIAGRGSVVTVGSVAGMTGVQGLAVYAATKAALIGMTQSLALEYGKTVRFNVVCPGHIGTRMMASTLSDATAAARLAATVPNGRIGTPEEVAEAMIWLLSDAAAYVNGAVLAIDGGMTAGFMDS